jgi:hypothetical protein
MNKGLEFSKSESQEGNQWDAEAVAALLVPDLYCSVVLGKKVAETIQPKLSALPDIAMEDTKEARVAAKSLMDKGIGIAKGITTDAAKNAGTLMFPEELIIPNVSKTGRAALDINNDLADDLLHLRNPSKTLKKGVNEVVAGAKKDIQEAADVARKGAVIAGKAIQYTSPAYWAYRLFR